MPHLLDALDDDAPGVQRAAASSLEAMAPLALAAVPRLIRNLTDPDADDDVRAASASTLGAIGAPAADAGPALIRALHDRGEYVRDRAVGALGKIRPVPEQAVPALFELMTTLPDEDWEFRLYAWFALDDYGAAAVPTLLRLAICSDGVAQSYAEGALLEIAGQSEDAVAILDGARADGDARVRELAERLLEQLARNPARPKWSLPAERGCVSSEVCE